MLPTSDHFSKNVIEFWSCISDRKKNPLSLNKKRLQLSQSEQILFLISLILISLQLS